MLLYHIADVHIGREAKYLGKELFEIQKEHLERMYLKAVEDGASFVVIAGDLFDSNYVPSEKAREVLELIIKFASVKTVILPGGGSRHEGEITGHDAYTEDSIYKRPDIAIYFEKENLFLLSPVQPVLKVGETAFYGGFFEIPDYPEEDARYHVAVVHGAFGKNRGEKDPALFEGTFYDYVALGHYHSYRQFGKSAYPGAFIQFEFSRSRILDSGFLKVRIDSGLGIERVVFDDAPRFYKVEILSREDAIRLEKELKPLDFVEIEGYAEETELEIRRLLKNEHIRLREDAYVIKKDPMLHMINRAIREITQDEESEVQKELESFIMRFLRKKPKKPDIEGVLRRFFEL